MSDKVKQLTDTIKELRVIADRYAALYYDGSHQRGHGHLYGGVRVDERGPNFSFDVGPSPHGMTTHISLPLSLLDECSDARLQAFVDAKTAKDKAEREANTCNTCGHNKYYNQISYGGSFGIY